jgi:hypothetical protein
MSILTQEVQKGPLTWDNRSGAERTRTADPLLAKQVLYQLSYRPGDDAENAVKNSGSRPRRTLALV